MTILIAGATGFLGSYLVKLFIDNGYKVIALKRSTSNTCRIDDCLNQLIIYDIDKTEISTVLAKHNIDVVINTVTNYGRINNKISSIVATNLIFGLKLLEESVNANIKAFINTDTFLDREINAYALSKSQLVDWMSFLSNKNTKMVNVKIEHMYGPLDDENKFIYWLIKQLKENAEEIDLTLGIQKRDFIYIDDIVNAYRSIINNIDQFCNFEEFELGAGKSIDVKSFIQKIYREISKKQKLTTKLNFGAISYRDNENMNMEANIEKLNQLGWKSNVSIEDGIKKIIEEEN